MSFPHSTALSVSALLQTHSVPLPAPGKNQGGQSPWLAVVKGREVTNRIRLIAFITACRSKWNHIWLALQDNYPVSVTYKVHMHVFKLRVRVYVYQAMSNTVSLSSKIISHSKYGILSSKLSGRNPAVFKCQAMPTSLHAHSSAVLA